MTFTNIISQIQARNRLDDFDFEKVFNTTMEERITNFTSDPLVLACALKSYIEAGNGYLSLDDPRLVELITPETKALAENIRNYYTKKFFWRALSNDNLSDYRRRLINLLENRITKCKDQDCGIYYKLPWFYEEDMTYEKFKDLYTTESLARVPYPKTKEVFELEFIKSTLSTQRKRKIERFWFTDNQYLFCVEVEHSNPLIDMFRFLIEESKKLKIQGFRNEDRIDKMNFYKLYQFNFVKEQQ